MLSQEVFIAAIPHVLQSVSIPEWGEKQSGKVRDMYQRAGLRLLITTDRVSAFDRVVGAIPYKGQVLNQLSEWWFKQTESIVPNHLQAVPDPNVMLVREAEPLPIEVIVRGYITGVTSTSLWTLYQQGERTPYGIPLPEGLQKNDPLPRPIITPTTKAEQGQHDQRLTRDEILQQGLVAEDLYHQIESVALGLFDYGQAVANQAGLILVDTKYEFGLIDGQLALIDEIHTPDSSRYWVAGGDQSNPENFDKEFLREWFVEQGYRGEGAVPSLPTDFIALVAGRYVAAYERLTGLTFIPGAQPAEERIIQTMQDYQITGA